MKKLAEKVLDLRIATRKACMCEDVENGKSTLSLKTKVLYCISKGYSPKDIMLALSIGKTNLAAISKSLIEGGLVLKNQGGNDKREVEYSLTTKGRRYLNKCCDNIEKLFSSVFTQQDRYDEAVKTLDDALEIFSYVDM